MNISDQIKRHRLERGWSQEYLGQLLHVTKQTVSSWENGKSTPTLDSIILLCCTFNITADELICLNVSPSEQSSNTEDTLQPDAGLLEVDEDLALDYLDCCQSKSKRALKRIISSFICLIIGLVVSELGTWGSLFAITLAILSLFQISRTARKESTTSFEKIETGYFILNKNARSIIEKKKHEYQESAMINTFMAIFGMMGLLLWFIDSYIDNGGCLSNGMLCVLLSGILIVLSACMPLAQHWYAIRVLLHETAPQICTPFSLDFWKNK